MLREASEAGEVERQETRSSHGLGTRDATRYGDHLVAALNNWDKNAEKKIPTLN